MTPAGSRTARAEIGVLLLPSVISLALVAAFYRYNMLESRPRDLLIPSAVALGTSLVALALAAISARKRAQAALVATAWTLAGLTFGHVLDLIDSSLSELEIHRQLQVLSLAVLILVYVSRAILKTRAPAIRVLVTTAWGFGGFLLIFNGVPISAQLVADWRDNDGSPSTAAKNATSEVVASIPLGYLPDIYLIILDEFASAGTVEELFGWNDRYLEKSLRECGFSVRDPAEAISNNTVEVIASIFSGELVKSQNYNLLFSRIKENPITSRLDELGYRVESYPAYHYADRFSPMAGASVNADPYEIAGTTAAVNTFTYVWLRTTAFRPLVTLSLGQDFRGSVNAAYSRHIFEVLRDAPSIERPTFIYAHITCPHPPYVFDRHGRDLGFASYDGQRFYLGQYQFVSKEMAEIACSIVRESKEAPIVILQSDHGVRGEKHASVGFDESHWRDTFRAVHLPGDRRKEDPAALPPSEDFPMIFHEYLGIPADPLPRASELQ